MSVFFLELRFLFLQIDMRFFVFIYIDGYVNDGRNIVDNLRRGIKENKGICRNMENDFYFVSTKLL
jgi:hypothetical protein